MCLNIDLILFNEILGVVNAYGLFGAEQQIFVEQFSMVNCYEIGLA